MLQKHTNPLIVRLAENYFPTQKLLSLEFLRSEKPLQIPTKVLSSKSSLNCLVPYAHAVSQESF